MSRFVLHAVLVDFIHEVSHISADSSFLRSAKARFLRSYACRHAVPQNLVVGPRLGLSHTGQIRPYRLSKPRFLRLISEAFTFPLHLYDHGPMSRFQRPPAMLSSRQICFKAV